MPESKVIDHDGPPIVLYTNKAQLNNSNFSPAGIQSIDQL